MKTKAAIIDLSINNIKSIVRTLEILTFDVKVFSKKFNIEEYDLIVLPGVGSFSKGSSILKKNGLIETINEAHKQNKNILGICLGMQLLLSDSEEFGYTLGIDLIKGNVKNFLSETEAKKINIGWKKILLNQFFKDDKFFKYLETNNLLSSYYYFVHSFYAKNVNKNDILASSKNFNFEFPSIIKKNNIYGFQFHPEKSGESGLKLLQFFLKN